MLTANLDKLQVIPHGLETLKQFINYRVVQGEKLPVNALGEVIDANDSHNWLTAQEASLSEFPIGFVTNASDNIFIIDIDDAFDERGQLNNHAQQIFNMFPGIAYEVSQSGKGIHLFGSGANSITVRHRKRLTNLEFYTDKRFIALTGTHKQGSATLDFSLCLSQFIDVYGLTLPEGMNPLTSVDDIPVPEYTGPAEDPRLIDMMLNHRGGIRVQFGQAVHFKNLWNANSDMLARHFPGGHYRTDGCAFDRSRADMALMTHLAFWTGKHPSRMWRLFQQSELYRQDKYIGRGAYRIDLLLNGGVKFANRVYDKVPDAPKKQDQAFGQLHLSGSDLLKQDFPDREFLVDGIIPAGHVMLAAEPKIGKSFMALQLGYAIATRQQFLRQDVAQGSVLHFALEEDSALIQERLRGLDHRYFGNGLIDRMTFITGDTDVANMDAGFVDNLERHLVQNPHTRLVTIDTFHMVRPEERGRESIYAYDRRSVNPLTSLARKFPKLTILNIHHTSKRETNNPQDLVSGSRGLTGGVDAYYVLHRVNGVLTLHGSGRRVKDFDYALSFNAPCWDLIGDLDNMPMTPVEEKVHRAMRELGELVGVSQLAVAVGMNVGNIHRTLKSLVDKERVAKHGQKYFTL